MCLHGCIIFLQQYSACYGNYKADRDQCVDQSSASVLCSGGVHANLADAPLADSCKNAAEDAAKVGIARVLVQETTNQDRNKMKPGSAYTAVAAEARPPNIGFEPVALKMP